MFIGACVIPICIQVGRPSLGPGTPGGSEEPTASGYPGVLEVRRGERRSDNEGIHLKANWYKVEKFACITARL